MGAGETIALIAVVVLLIVILGITYSAYEVRLKFKQRALELAAKNAGSGADKRVAQLEARVRVLERIATDRGQIASAELAAKIDTLREERAEGEPA
jgi:CHASE1-domain containing sensor protein